MNHITSHRGRVYKFRILEGVFLFHQNSVRLHATLICMHAQGKFGESARLSLFLHAILSSLSVECLSQLPARRASHKHTPTGMWMGVDPAALRSQERPPDLHGDFHGDRERWDVARDVWYTATTGKQLPATGAGEACGEADREAQWTKALKARSKRRKRAAQSGPQGDARRAQHAAAMAHSRDESFSHDARSLITELSDTAKIAHARQQP